MIENLGEILAGGMVIFWLIGAIASLFFQKPSASNNRFAYVASFIGSLFGVALSIKIIISQSSINFPVWSVTPMLHFSFSIDLLAAFFLFIISLVSAILAIYSPKYTSKYLHDKNVFILGAGFNLFLLSMAGVVLAANGFTFLVLWELMSLVSFFLVIYEHERQEVPYSGLLYIIMTHIGTGFIIISFLILYLHSGSLDFSLLSGMKASWSNEVQNLVFVLALIGFGTKAGLVPVHIWLPEAHPSAPSHISALMSAVMIKTALYAMIRFVYGFLGVSSIWWGITLIVVGIITAIYGILYAVIQQDMKRFLAYSSVENMGLIFVGLGSSFLFYSLGQTLLAVLALIAALYHALNHAFFKSLLFMGAGSVYFATGRRNIESLGGLIRYMPYTAGFFLVASLAIASFPPFNGFVSKWLTLQSLFALAFLQGENVWLSLLGVFALLILAIVGALVGIGFVKLFGLTFLAQERSKDIRKVKEVPISMRLAMGVASVATLLLGIFPSQVISYLNRITSPFIPNLWLDAHSWLAIKTPSELPSTISPIIILLILMIALFILLLFVRAFYGKSKFVRRIAWACGIKLEPDMSYSGVSMTHPLQIIFKFIYGNSYYSSKQGDEVIFGLHFRKVFSQYIYNPAIQGFVVLSKKIRKIQNGSIHTYLAYVFITLIIVLLVVTMA